MTELPALAGTFTGFLQSLAEKGIVLQIWPSDNSVHLYVSRGGKYAQVALSLHSIKHAKADIASIELGDIISAVL
jgi:hypothetical protein